MGCSKEIEVDQPAYEKKIAVDGWIEQGNFAHVILTLSSPFLTEYDSVSIRNTFLNYAKVTVTTGSGESEVLTLFRQSEFFPPFIYKTIRIKGKEGESYSLKIETLGKTVTSTTMIPSAPLVTSMRMVPASDTTGIIEAVVDDPADEVNYYYSQIKTKGMDSRYHPSAFPFTVDNTINGTSAVIHVKRSNQPDPLGIYGIDMERNLPRTEFALTDTVSVKVSTIDKDSYLVLNGIFMDQLNNGNPFSFIDQKTATNITGGVGRWTGMSSRSTRVVYEKE